ncbi:predicted protein [Streptomyces lividans TK24]|nr:predicted protein [Streptomyces lividans TK24]
MSARSAGTRGNAEGDVPGVSQGAHSPGFPQYGQGEDEQSWLSRSRRGHSRGRCTRPLRRCGRCRVPGRWAGRPRARWTGSGRCRRAGGAYSSTRAPECWASPDWWSGRSRSPGRRWPG